VCDRRRETQPPVQLPAAGLEVVAEENYLLALREPKSERSRSGSFTVTDLARRRVAPVLDTSKR